MYKNQLQELAQRSCFSLPSYCCIREGPDHAPRFKAIVSFNDETFESSSFCSTLRQAEHAAAEVALNSLSKRGPSQSIGARMLDETGVCKNLLQETAQRGGASLPVYTTIRSGPGHLPVFKCTVQVGGLTFVGKVAKTKKQAEKNAAMTALSALKSEVAVRDHRDLRTGHERAESHLTDASPIQPYEARRKVRVDHARDSPNARFQSGLSLHSEAGQGFRQIFLNNDRSNSCFSPLPHQSSPSTSSFQQSSAVFREFSAASRAAVGVAGNTGRLILPSSSSGEVKTPLEEHLRDEEEWLGGEISKANLQKEDTSTCNRAMWSISSSSWSFPSPTLTAACSAAASKCRRATTSMAPPVRIRQIATVCSAPPPKTTDHTQILPVDSKTDQEAVTLELLSQLRL